jgi:hypothetical protein
MLAVGQKRTPSRQVVFGLTIRRRDHARFNTESTTRM